MDTGSKIQEQKKIPGESWGEPHSGLFLTCNPFVSKVADGLGSGVRQPGARPNSDPGEAIQGQEDLALASCIAPPSSPSPVPSPTRCLQ